MKLLKSRVLWGILLILVGVLFLLESLAILSLGGAWAVVFAAAGLIFAYSVIEDRERWWAVIPAMALLGIAALVGLDAFFPGVDGEWGGGIFLGALSISFWIIYIATRREQWWALIPGGVLLALAAAVPLEPYISEGAFGGLVLLGIGLTFAIVYALPTPEGRMKWALIPAAILGFIGLTLLAATGGLPNLVWPVLLIVVGGYILLHNLRK